MLNEIFVLTGLVAWLVYGGFILLLFIAEVKDFGSLAFVALAATCGILYKNGATVDFAHVWQYVLIYLAIGIGYAFYRRFMYFKGRDNTYKKAFATFEKKIKTDVAYREQNPGRKNQEWESPLVASHEEFQKTSEFRNAVGYVNLVQLAYRTSRWIGNWPASFIVHVIETIFPRFFEGIVNIFKGFFKIADNIGKGDWEKQASNEE